MSAVFFQSIGESVKAVVASLVRDILCFTPLAILLPYVFENRTAGNGIYGILLAAPIADLVAIVVVVCLTIPFFRTLNQKAAEQTEAPISETETSVIKPSKKGTIITIAREHGTTGKQIGKLVAE